MKTLYITTAIIALILQESKAINWNGNNWALMCDFVGHDIENVMTDGSNCGSLCWQTNGCTHFAYKSGICYLKSGSVTYSDAIVSNDSSSSCGIIHETTTTTAASASTTQSYSSTTTTVNSDSTTNTALLELTNCQFTYGRDYTGDSTDYSSYNYITIWIGTIASGCSGRRSCTDFNQYYQGSMLRKTVSLGKIPVFYAYIIAFEARNDWNLQDCNVGYPNLCQQGSKYIRENYDHIVERYKHQSSNIATYIGRNGFCVFLIEPDFWQYYGDTHTQEGGTLSGEQMRALYDDIAAAIKKNLPNAALSWDISAWIGQEGMKTWWEFFKSSTDIDFINTSGGEGQGGSSEFKPNELTWEFLSTVTGKKIIADSGYGVGGGGLNNRYPWYDKNNVNNRIADGVATITLAGSNQNPSYTKSIC